MHIAVNISDKRLRALISGAGSRYWADDFEWMGPLDFSIVEYEDGPPKTYFVTHEMIQAGLEKMAASPTNSGGHHFKDCMEGGSDDAYTGDALIQFTIFGELKYG